MRIFLILFTSFAVGFSVFWTAHEHPIKGTANYASGMWQTQNELETPMLMSLSKIPRCDLLQQLARMKVFIKETYASDEKSTEKLFDNAMLVNLISYFAITQAIGPFYLYASERKGPELVQDIYGKEPGTHILFSANAGDTIQIRAIEEIPQKNRNRMEEVGEIAFSNTLFQQLSKILLSRDQLKNLIHGGMGILLTPDKNERDYSAQTEFTSEELVSILKVFLDLPINIRKGLALKRIIRMSDYYSFPAAESIIAEYSTSTQIIRMKKEVFTNSSATGEDNFSHELGHALWTNIPENLKKSFIDLSWVKEKSGSKFIIKSGPVGFISDYSKTNFNEDFAEHFAGYIQFPEKLKSTAKDKYHFMEKIFFDTTYQTRASSNAKIFIESENPDTTAPTWEPKYKKKAWWWGESIVENISVSCKPTDFTEDNKLWKGLTITVNMKDVYDDISGVKEISVTLRGENDESGWGRHDICLSGQGDICRDPKLGIYEFGMTKKSKDIFSDTYRVHSIRLTDRAGNVRTVALGNTDAKVAIAGLANEEDENKIIQTPAPPLDVQNIRVTQKSTDDEYFEVMLPIQVPAKKFSINLVWRSKKVDKKVYHSIDCSALAPLSGCIVNAKRTFVLMKIRFPEKLGSDDFELDGVVVKYNPLNEKDPNYDEYDLARFYYPTTSAKISIHHQAKIELPSTRIDVNRMALSEDRRKNNRGGETSIVMDVPIENMDSLGTFSLDLTFQTPSGKQISAYKYNPAAKDGKSIRAWADLPPNHEAGEYILKKIAFTPSLEDSRPGIVTANADNFLTITIIPSEIGITKRIMVPKNSAGIK